MTEDEAIADAKAKHPDCEHAEWRNGMNGWLQLTIVVLLWRTTECYEAGDPPKYTCEGYVR